MIVLKISIVLLLVGSGHQHLDVLADDFMGFIAEQTQAGGIAGLHPTCIVDDNYTVGSSLYQRLQL